MIKQTSLDAYIDNRNNGKLSNQEQQILARMMPNIDYTRRELSALTGLETSTVSGRVNDMLGIFIEVVGKRKCRQSKRTVEAIKVIV